MAKHEIEERGDGLQRRVPLVERADRLVVAPAADRLVAERRHPLDAGRGLPELRESRRVRVAVEADFGRAEIGGSHCSVSR